MDTQAGIFGFERDFIGALNCIPMSVRLKLDYCGVKISLAQWNQLATREREQLLDLPCDSTETAERYRQRLMDTVESSSGRAPKTLDIEAHPPWAAGDHIPEQLRAQFAALQLPPLTVPQWSGLSPLQRFSLLKLSQPGHDNDNFIPALREFGLLTS